MVSHADLLSAIVLNVRVDEDEIDSHGQGRV